MTRRGNQKGVTSVSEAVVTPATVKTDFITREQLRTAASLPDDHPYVIALVDIIESWMTSEQFDQAVHIAHTLARKPLSNPQSSTTARTKQTA